MRVIELPEYAARRSNVLPKRGVIPIAPGGYPRGLEVGSARAQRERFGDMVNELETQKVQFQSITDGIATKTAAGRFFFHVMVSPSPNGARIDRGAHPCGPRV